MALHLVIEPEFGLCIIMSSLLAFQCIIMGFLLPGQQRAKIYNQTYMDENFQEMHTEYTHKKILKFGYPDMGNGFYSEKLSYKDWLQFNKAQRVHYNLVEVLFAMMLFVMLGGLYYPTPSLIFGIVFFVSRILFVWYMDQKGTAHPLRIAGAILQDLALLSGFILSIMSSVSMIKKIN